METSFRRPALRAPMDHGHGHEHITCSACKIMFHGRPAYEAHMKKVHGAK